MTRSPHHLTLNRSPNYFCAKLICSNDPSSLIFRQSCIATLHSSVTQLTSKLRVQFIILSFYPTTDPHLNPPKHSSVPKSDRVTGAHLSRMCCIGHCTRHAVQQQHEMKISWGAVEGGGVWLNDDAFDHRSWGPRRGI